MAVLAKNRRMFFHIFGPFFDTRFWHTFSLGGWFSSFSRSLLEAIFPTFFFWRRLRAPSNFFLVASGPPLGLGILRFAEAKTPFSHVWQGRCWHRFWTSKTSQNWPSEFFPKSFVRFLSLPKILEKIMSPRWPAQNRQNRPKSDFGSDSTSDFILEPILDPSWTHLGPILDRFWSKNNQNVKNPIVFHFASWILLLRRAVFRHPYRGLALAVSKTHYVFTITCAILH